MLCLLFGCKPGVPVGKLLTFPDDKNAELFAASSVSECARTNRYGEEINGLIIRDASWIQNGGEIRSSKKTQYVLFHDFNMGQGAKGAYWQQRASKQAGLGIPVYDTRLTSVTLILVDSNGIVQQAKDVRVAHLQLSVDTNDFSRVLVP